MIEDIKLIHRSAGGTLVQSSATIERKDGRIWFLKSPFALKDEIKAMAGAKWHGYENPPRMVWSVADCQRNNFQLGFLKGEDVYAWFDREVVQHEYTRPLMGHQKELSDHFLTYHYGIMAAEMRCVEGNAIVSINRAGKGFSTSLRELCYKFNGGKSTGKRSTNIRRMPIGRSWDLSIPTHVRGYRGKDIGLGLTRVQDVLFKGVKPVIRLILEDGRSLRVTEDHEVCVGCKWYGSFKAAGKLRKGDCIVTEIVDPRPTCFAVRQEYPAVFTKTARQGMGVSLNTSGYLNLSGMRGHPRATHGNHNFVAEHVVVVEETIGRGLVPGECVHHLNGQRWDNRPENLVLCRSRKEHMRLFHSDSAQHFQSGATSLYTAFQFSRIAHIDAAGETDVYDIICEGPYHNFVANGFVVHNCGKTLSVQEVMERLRHQEVVVGRSQVEPAQHAARVQALEHRPVDRSRDDDLRGPCADHGGVGAGHSGAAGFGDRRVEPRKGENTSAAWPCKPCPTWCGTSTASRVTSSR